MPIIAVLFYFKVINSVIILFVKKKKFLLRDKGVAVDTECGYIMEQMTGLDGL